MASKSVVQRLFGLSVCSNLPIPYTIELPHDSAVDVTVTAGRMPQGFDAAELIPRQIDRFESPYALAAGSGRFLLTYDDGSRFVIERDAIWMTWESPLNFDDAATYLVGAAFALLLRMRGAACLHASAVAEGESVTAFAGPSGCGKSTIAGARLLAGATLVAEDMLPLVVRDGRVVALPAYAGVRLWPEAAEFLCGSRDALALISPTWDKRILRAERFAAGPVVLSSIVFLGDRDAPLTPAEATMRLVASSYRPEMLDAEMRRCEFSIFAELAAHTPMRDVPSRDRALLGVSAHV